MKQLIGIFIHLCKKHSKILETCIFDKISFIDSQGQQGRAELWEPVSKIKWLKLKTCYTSIFQKHKSLFDIKT